MVLGAALARIRLGKAPNAAISKADRKGILEAARPPSKMKDDTSHPIDGLALLLVTERIERRAGLAPSEAEAQTDQILHEHALSIGANWRPRLRYQTLVPSADEVEAVREAAAWLLAHFDEF